MSRTTVDDLDIRLDHAEGLTVVADDVQKKLDRLHERLDVLDTRHEEVMLVLKGIVGRFDAIDKRLDHTEDALWGSDDPRRARVQAGALVQHQQMWSAYSHARALMAALLLLGVGNIAGLVVTVIRLVGAP